MPPSLEECGVAVLRGVADGEVPLPRHHHRQEGRRVQQHRLKKGEEGMNRIGFMVYCAIVHVTIWNKQNN